MNIKLNGKTIACPYKSAFELAKSFFDSGDVVIVNGFQIKEDIELLEGDEVTIIKKGKPPSYDQLESMMAARHTPKVHGKVKKARVAICGLGGLGSNIALMLARTGVGYLRLIDFDTVEPSNLNRQSFYIRHLGMMKTAALEEQIKEINPFIETDLVNEKVTRENAKKLLEGCSIVCEAFDNPKDKAMLAEEVMAYMPEKILVCGSGMAGFESSNDIVSRKVAERLYICGDGVNEAKPGRGLMAPRVGICAAHQANMILRLIMEIYEP